MIKIQKLAEPDVLKNNAKGWLQDLKDAIVLGDKKLIDSRKARYNHKEIKAAAKQETHGKCAYCECNVTAVSHGDIEHIFPKSLDIERTFEWENLGFSCQICNQNKSDTNPESESIIDPYTTNPSDFIMFVGGLINSKGTVEGVNTILTLKLNRAELNERRLNTMKAVLHAFELIQMARNPQEKALFIQDFENNELGPEREFAAMRRDFWKVYKDQL